MHRKRLLLPRKASLLLGSRRKLVCPKSRLSWTQPKVHRKQVCRKLCFFPNRAKLLQHKRLGLLQPKAYRHQVRRKQRISRMRGRRPSTLRIARIFHTMVYQCQVRHMFRYRPRTYGLCLLSMAKPRLLQRQVHQRRSLYPKSRLHLNRLMARPKRSRSNVKCACWSKNNCCCRLHLYKMKIPYERVLVCMCGEWGCLKGGRPVDGVIAGKRNGNAVYSKTQKGKASLIQ